ncbi:hypothetical protein V5N11_015502 [Cardamine amara subsp. amara]|uniref:RNase H type-1 domain-containing protein n=1 Tax=Cardamine amara subsp. amara TaxID=228776 RepID=A0ABD1AM98_CARAN
MPVYHGRDAFLPITNRLSAELEVILWTVRSLKDLHISRFDLWSDCGTTITALDQPEKWPLYRSVLDQIIQVMSSFHSCCFKASSFQANTIARDIARSMTIEG